MTGGRARILRATLGGLDGIEVDAIGLPMRRRRRQPTGVAGLIDWRAGGQLARVVRDERFEGRVGEHLLTVVPAVGAARIFLFGVGEGEPARDDAVRALAEAGSTRVALAPLEGAESVPEALGWLRALEAWRGRFELVVLFDVDRRMEAQRERIAGAARRAGLELEERREGP